MRKEHEILRDIVLLLYKKLDLPFLSSDAKKLQEHLKKNERFFRAVTRKKGKRLILKIRLRNDLEVARDLQREIKILHFLGNNQQHNKMPVPRIISHGKFKGLEWYLREYQTGNLAGHMDENHGFQKKFLEIISPGTLSDLVHKYQLTYEKKVGKFKINRHGGWWYNQDFNFYKNNFLKIFLRDKLNDGILNQSDINKAGALFKKNKNLLDRGAKYLCHGDLYPNNILLTPDNKVSILDWGLGHLNNQYFDAVFIYLNAWRDEKWRVMFIKKFMSRRKISGGPDALFQIAVISLAIRFSGHCWKFLNDKKVSRTQKRMLRKLLNKNLKILKVALDDPLKII